MAKIAGRAKLDFELAFTVNEAEARALDAMASYGEDAFIKAFYEKLGSAYMKEHEDGLREFLKSIRGLVSPELSRLDDARKAFVGKARL